MKNGCELKMRYCYGVDHLYDTPLRIRADWSIKVRLQPSTKRLYGDTGIVP